MNFSAKFSFFKLFLLVNLFFFCTPVFSKNYEKKIYLWENIPKMETQKRDTILYYCPPTRTTEIVGSSSTMTETENSHDSGNSLASKAPAVIICPGGSYHHLGLPHEGFASARWFSSHGLAAFVLRYRVAYNCHHYPDQLEDIQMAIVYIREHAEEFNIDKNKIGAIGYSAGGHLVTMAGEFAQTHDEISKLGIKTEESLRPDFVMPIYPVVSMQDNIGHKWSRKSILGHQWKEPNATKSWRPWNFWGHAYSKALKDEFSMELNVPNDMPPTFILACVDDPVVIYENSVRLDKALSEKGIPHKFVTYPKGGHGFGMKENSYIMKETHWNDEDLLPWLKEIGILTN